MPRVELERGMRPCVGRRLRAGEAVMLRGAQIHAGPEVAASGAERVIVFFSCRPPEAREGYDKLQQLNGFTIPFLARNARETVLKAIEWYRPAGPYAARPWESFAASAGATEGEEAAAERARATVRAACEDPAAGTEAAVRALEAAFAEGIVK